MSKNSAYSINNNDNETRKNDFNIISLHSAKGGVGKTSTAFMYAQSIIKKHNRENTSRKIRIDPYVFIFDLDFTGTELREACLYEDEKINYLQEKKSFHTNAISSMSSIYSLYCEFDNYMDYLNCNEIFKTSDVSKEKTDYSQQAHILVSGGFSNEFKNKKWYLYEPFHIQSLVDFIYQLMIDFTSHVTKYNQIINETSVNNHTAKCYFILDNASGWSKLRDSLEYLLLLHNYKKIQFLFITSADRQDIDATLDEIWGLYIKSLKTQYTIQKVYYNSRSNMNTEPLMYQSSLLDKTIEKKLQANREKYALLKKSFDVTKFHLDFSFCASIINKVFYDSIAPTETKFMETANKAFMNIMKKHPEVRSFLEKALANDLKFSDDGTNKKFVEELLFKDNNQHRIINPFSMDLALIFSFINKEEVTNSETENIETPSKANEYDTEAKEIPYMTFYQLENEVLNSVTNIDQSIVIFNNNFIDYNSISYFSTFLRTLFSVCSICEKIVSLYTPENYNTDNDNRGILNLFFTESKNFTASKKLSYNKTELYHSLFIRCYINSMIQARKSQEKNSTENDGFDDYFDDNFEFIDTLYSTKFSDQVLSRNPSELDYKSIFNISKSFIQKTLNDNKIAISELPISRRKISLLYYCISSYFSIIFYYENFQTINSLSHNDSKQQDNLEKILSNIVMTFQYCMEAAISPEKGIKTNDIKRKITEYYHESLSSKHFYNLSEIFNESRINEIVKECRQLYQSLHGLSKKHNYIFTRFLSYINDQKIAIPPTEFSYIKECIIKLFQGCNFSHQYYCSLYGKELRNSGHIKIEPNKACHNTVNSDLSDQNNTCKKLRDNRYYCNKCVCCQNNHDYIDDFYQSIFNMLYDPKSFKDRNNYQLEEKLIGICNFNSEEDTEHEN